MEKPMTQEQITELKLEAFEQLIRAISVSLAAPSLEQMTKQEGQK